MDENIHNANLNKRKAVKSQAVVKFSAVQAARFNRLECNTNLNLPPSNWLTTSDSSYGLHQALYQSSGFASFRMAHMFPDCVVGEVDVVSDAENIKKLLKLPYTNKGVISMIVHKVGNTLLLDEFDIQKYLLRRADDDWKWLRTFILEQILAYGEKDHNVCLKDKSREALQTKNLLSKFLYYSLKQSGSETPVAQEQHIPRPSLPLIGPVLPEPKIEENVPDPKTSHEFNRNVLWTFEDIRMLIGTDMPIFGGPNRPCISLRLRDMAKPINVLTGIDYWLDNLMCNVPEVVMCYHLDGIVQKYEIIKTEDLPYLENSQFSPQVVRNVAQNILAFLKANATKAGHTYWLFKGRNDDVVKLYDLTTLCKNQTSTNENSDEKSQENPFTVPVAMLLYSVARNMKNTKGIITPKTAGNIRALLDNCIKLLPKEKYPQIVTSSHYILSDLHVPEGIDPKSPKFDISDIDSDTQSIYEEEEDIEDSDDSDDECDGFNITLNENAEMSENVAVKSICDTLKEFRFSRKCKNTKHTPSPLIGSTEERCSIALDHISAGMSCLQFFNSNEEEFIKESEMRAKDDEKQRILEEEQNPTMAMPFSPIPLPYISLRKRQSDKVDTILKEQSVIENENQFIIKSEKDKKIKKNKVKHSKMHLKDSGAETFSSQNAQLQYRKNAINFNSQLFGSWDVHLKLLLFEKACLTYATLAEHNYMEQRYGTSLKAIYMSARCQQVVLKYMSTIPSQKSCLLGRAGDSFFQMARNWDSIDQYIKQYNEINDIEINIKKELDKELTDADETDFIRPLKNIEHLMASSCKCYENALQYVKEVGSDVEAVHELLRRLGNVRNELGVKYMYWSQEEYAKTVDNQCEERSENDISLEEPLYVTLAMKSFDSLTRGIAAFNEVQDNVNLAFLFCNMGRFMRFRAHVHTPTEKIDYVERQKTFYNEAFINYKKARDILGSRKSNAELWDLVNWELSTATFTLAKQLQDYSTTDDACIGDLEKELLDLLQSSLKLCDVEHSGARQILYTYRSGLIHKRIASFHYSQLRRHCTDSGTFSKTSLQLCKHHYEKAALILENLKEVNDHLIVQLERISLHEFLVENSANNAQKIKNMQVALEICLNSKSIFQNAFSIQFTNENVNSQEATNEQFINHMLLFESRLQNALKTLIKMLLNGKDSKNLSELYKKMYMETLTGKRITGEQKLTLENVALKLNGVLQRLIELKQIYKNIQ